MPSLLDGQPTLYARLFPAFFREAVPEERKATCSSCAMTKTSAGAEIAAFNPATKCCTYHPKLPNYLVGALLADTDPAFAKGRERVRGAVAAKRAVTPQWVMPTAKHAVLYKNAAGGFGRAKALRCPYYEEDGGLCTIWPYREAVCATYFCKYVGGADGRDMWMSYKRYLSLAEIQLSRYALLQVYPEWVVRQGDSPKSEPGALTPSELDETGGDEAAHRAEWGPWAGREEELYRACHDVVRGLDEAQFTRLLGLDGDVHVKVLEALRRAMLSPQLPAKPRLNPALTVKHLEGGDVALGFHSPYDAIALPEGAYRLLALFRGEETTEAVRKRLRDEHATDFADEILEELHRHRILI